MPVHHIDIEGDFVGRSHKVMQNVNKSVDALIESELDWLDLFIKGKLYNL